MTRVKICGLTTAEATECCRKLAVDFCGFVCYPPSSRHLSAQSYAQLTGLLDRAQQATVLVTVNETNAVLEEYFTAHKPRYLQCHGQETPQQLLRLRERYDVGIIKSIPVSAAEDLAALNDYDQAADILLIDTRPAPGQLPGGNARTFDWSLLEGVHFPLPWMLSGGLNADNIRRAIAATHAPMVDVSSGVESARGVKNPALIKQFVNHVRTLHQAA